MTPVPATLCSMPPCDGALQKIRAEKSHRLEVTEQLLALVVSPDHPVFRLSAASGANPLRCRRLPHKYKHPCCPPGTAS